MKAPPFEYHKASTLDEALDLLSSLDNAKVIAGGQSLLPLLALRLGRPDHLVDIGGIGVLESLATDPDGALKIGALVTHRQVETSELVETAAPLLAQAAPLIGHRAIRSRGTICGSLAHADPAAELPAVALACEARLTAVSNRGAREINAEDFFRGYLDNALDDDELVTRVRFPAWPATRGSAVVEVARRSGDYAVLGLACWVDLDADEIADARMVFFGAGDRPTESSEAQRLLIGRPLGTDVVSAAADVAADELHATADVHASANYRRHLARVLTQRGLTQAAETARHTSQRRPGGDRP